MIGRVGPAMALDHGDGARQRGGGRLVAVDHALGLAVVLADADRKRRAFLIDDGPGHLQAEHLSTQDAMLDHGLGARSEDDVRETSHARVERRLGRQGRGLGWGE